MEGLSENINSLDEEVFETNAPSLDTVPPIINIKSKTYSIKTNDDFKFLNDVTASDAVDGDLTHKIQTNINELDFSKPGVKTVNYSVFDSAGNKATEVVYVTVKKDDTNLIRIGQFSFLIILIIILIFLGNYIRSLKLEKRFSKFTLNSSKNKSISLFDSLYLQYQHFVDGLGGKVSKSSLLSKRAARYEKYVTAFNIDNASNFFARKMIVGFIFVILIVFVELLQFKLPNLAEVLISCILGFYFLDLMYIYKYYKYRKEIENDLLDAITIMNNAFKAGMSITQAIDLVSKEVNGDISKEFKKISQDISMGLDIEVAFKRFSSRIKCDEAVYLSSSLSVLNKTGGNIIKVFNSIEKNMFSRRKLENELKSLTASSKLIMVVLMIVPPLFIAFISIINKDYFKPLFTNPLGIALIAIIALIYITYIVVVKRVLKVRGIR